MAEAEAKVITLHPRRLARRVAKAELDRAGATGYNKPSKFSENWRKIAAKAIKREPAKKAGKKKREGRTADR